MANVKISELSSAASLTGSEEVAIVQSNATVKTTAQAIADLASGGLGTLDITTVGELGISGTVNYSIGANYSATATGAQSLPIVSFPNIFFTGNVSSTVSSISFPTLANAASVNIGNFSFLQTIDLPELLYAEGLNLTSNSALTTISAPKLVTIGPYGLTLGANSPFTTTSVSFSALTSARLTVNLSHLGLSSITSTIFPVLEEFSMSLQNATDLTEVILPSVTTISSNGFSITSYSYALTTFQLPNVETINAYVLTFNSNYSLTNFQLGTVGVTKTFNGNGSSPQIDLQGCSLSEASVDGVLQLWASLDGTNDTTNVSNGTLYLYGGSNSAPSQVGIDAKTILQGRGWNVLTN
jgi:hypothetical protein